MGRSLFWPCVVWSAAIGGCDSCVKKTEFYCDDPSDCESARCDVDQNICLPAIDGATIDGAIDAVFDAAPDANPVVMTYQPADLVIGQPDFVTEGDPGCTQAGVRPSAVSVDNGALFVGGLLQSRAIVFAPIPTTSHPNGTRVLGQSQFTVCQRQEGTATAIWDNAYVAAGGGKLISGDYHRRGVLVWSPAPTTTNEPADLVLGQPDFATQTAGTGPSQMANPSGQLWTDGTRVIIPDGDNNRVLMWTTFPTTSGAAANIVVGQPAFGLGLPPAVPTSSNLEQPSAVWSDGVRLVVADSSQNRVLIWNSLPTVNGQAADLVIGQPDFTTGTGGLSATKMSAPRGIAVVGDALFISDSGNDRVLVFSPFPNVNGEAAKYVLGQPDLTTGGNNPAAADRTLDDPEGLAAVAQHLWVVDRNHERVLRFTLALP